MAESFDPYLKWLGIRDRQRPPNHYRLLGLDLFESDRETIANAADRQMAHLRTFQNGPQSALSQRLLNEVAAAKLCLLNAEKKEAYDARLRRQAEARAGDARAPHAPLEAVEPLLPDLSQSDPRLRTYRLRRKSPLPMLLAVGLVIAVFAVGLYFLLPSTGEAPSQGVARAPLQHVPATDATAPPRARNDRSSSGEPASTPSARESVETFLESSKDDEPAAREPDIDAEPGEPPAGDTGERSPAADAELAADEPSKPIDSVPATESPQSRPSVDPPVQSSPEVVEAMAFVRNALANRDLDAARQRLDMAEGLDATPAQRFELQRLRFVFDCLAEFWEAAQRSASSLKPGDELIVDGWPCEVIDTQGDELVLQTRQPDGTAQRLRFPRQRVIALVDLPAPYFLALVERIRPGDARTRLLLGVFLAFDRNGEPSAARRYWEEAARGGASVAEVLEEFAVVHGDAAGESTEASAPRWEGPKLPPPDEIEQTAARREMESLFADDFANARTPEARLALAEKLLAAGADTRNNAAARYVLLREARNLAAEAGETSVAYAAIDALAWQHDIEPRAWRLETLELMGRNARGRDVHQRIAEAALQLLNAALADDDFEAARQASQHARTAAGRVRDRDLVREAAAADRRLQAVEEAYQSAAAQRDLLATDPDDAEANLAWGKYLCFVKRDWSRGLPHLARGADESLRELAEADLARPYDPLERLALADAWWERAADAEREAKPPLQERAAYWYELAAPFLAGIHRAKVDTRRKEWEASLGRPNAAARTAAGTAAVAVRRLQMVPLTETYGWTEVPSLLDGGFAFSGNRNLQSVEQGELQFEVLRSGVLFLAACWNFDGLLQGDASSPIVTREALIAAGWTPVETIVLQGERHDVFRRSVSKGERYQLRTRKYKSPYVIVTGQGAEASTTIVD